MPDKSIDVDTTYLIGKNGIARDANRVITELSSFYDICNVKFFGLNLNNNRILRRLLNIINLVFNLHIPIASKYHGIFYQPHLSSLKPGRNSQAWVIRLHDIFPLTNPEWFRWWAVIIFKRNLDFADRNGAVFLFSSEYSRSLFMKYYPDSFTRTFLSPCKPTPLDSVLCSICDGCFEISQNSRTSNTLLAVGTIEPRKNYDFLLTFWEEMHSKINGITRIVIVGKPGWKSKETQARLAYNSKLNLVWLKNSCDGSLCFFYQNARFFISTSKDEGFNLPALEARQLYGLPVILSDIPIHHEIHGKFATYFNDANELTSYLVTNNQEPKICNRSLIQIETPLRDLFDQIDRNFS